MKMADIRKCPYCDYSKAIVDVSEVTGQSRKLEYIAKSLSDVSKKVDITKDYCGSQVLGLGGEQLVSVDDLLDDIYDRTAARVKDLYNLAPALIEAAQDDKTRQEGEYNSHVSSCPYKPKPEDYYNTYGYGQKNTK